MENPDSLFRELPRDQLYLTYYPKFGSAFAAHRLLLTHFVRVASMHFNFNHKLASLPSPGGNDWLERTKLHLEMPTVVCNT